MLRVLHSIRAERRGKAKVCRNDLRGNCQYGSTCAFLHAQPRVSQSIPQYAVPYQPCYAYTPTPMSNVIIVHPGYSSRVSLPSHEDTGHIESSMRNMTLDVTGGKTPTAHGQPLPAPPSTPCSTITDMSSPESFVSMHLGSETSRASDESEQPRQRSSTGGSFYRSQ